VRVLDVDAVIFDLDDTLYPEREFAFSGFAAVAEAFQTLWGDAAAATRQMIELFDSPDRPRVFDALLRLRGIGHDPRVIEAMVDTYRRHSPRIELYPDARRCLDRLHHRVALGLITDGPTHTQESKVAALNLRDWIRVTVLTDTLGPGSAKPHPRAFEVLAEQLRVGHCRCVYVADNPTKDFIAPNALGWTTIQIRRSDGLYRDRVAPPGGQPGAIMDSLDQLEIARVPG
jgi:putative hydrolase of the HAD superfamily